MASHRALITGASSGIGAATAVALASRCAAVWLAYSTGLVRVERVAEECKSRGADVRVGRLDLRSEASVDALLRQVGDEWGHLNVLVNNGGVCPYTPLDRVTADEWDLVMEINARGTFLMSHRALPLLRSAEGNRCIVNVSSIAGQVGGLTTAIHYAASKAAILAITRTMARLLAAEGIRVNAVAPGPVESGITDQLDESQRRALAAQVPLGRFGEAEEVAQVIALLASRGGAFATGATYDVNGGLRME